MCVMYQFQGTFDSYLPIASNSAAYSGSSIAFGQEIISSILSIIASITCSVMRRNVSSATPNKCANLS